MRAPIKNEYIVIVNDTIFTMIIIIKYTSTTNYTNTRVLHQIQKDIKSNILNSTVNIYAKSNCGKRFLMDSYRVWRSVAHSQSVTYM